MKRESFAEVLAPLAGTNLLSIADLEREQILALVERAVARKADAGEGLPLAGRSVALIFEKPSLRTRVSFEVGLFRLGAQAVYLDHGSSPLGERESVEDLAAYLSRTVHAIVARVNSHESLRALAAASAVPVVNALSDLEHPCQALADLVTIRERAGELRGVGLAYIGDGNNVCHSLMLAGASVGMRVTVVTPEGRGPRGAFVSASERLAQASGGSVRVTTDPHAVRGHGVVYTDTWASMGGPGLTAVGRRAFEPYRVTARTMALASEGFEREAIFMHCLPAHRGDEVNADVIDGPRSVVYDQAENRLHAQNALMLVLLGQ